mgnify:CR=1 FL=1
MEPVESNPDADASRPDEGWHDASSAHEGSRMTSLARLPGWGTGTGSAPVRTSVPAPPPTPDPFGAPYIEAANGGSPGGAIPGGGTLPTPSIPRGGSGGGWQNFLGGLQGINATPTDYEQQVLDNYWLDLENNPWAQQYAGALTQEHDESLGRNLSMMASPFAGAGGTMGMSGINAATRMNAMDDSRENLSNSLSGFYEGLFQGERGRQQQTSGDISGRTQGLYGAGASAYSADQQRAASAYSSKVQAGAMIQAAQMAQALGYDQLAADMMFRAEEFQMEAARMARQAPLDYLSGLVPTMSPWTTSRTWGTGSTDQNAGGGWLGAALGGFGGGLYGRGAYDAFRPGGR